MIKVGDEVRYIGPEIVTYVKGNIYEVTAYDEELDMYGVMSELGDDYYISKEFIEEIIEKIKK